MCTSTVRSSTIPLSCQTQSRIPEREKGRPAFLAKSLRMLYSVFVTLLFSSPSLTVIFSISMINVPQIMNFSFFIDA